MTNKSPDFKVELTPKPEITKINRLAFLIACSVVAIIVFVLAYSVSKATTINSTPKADVIVQSSAVGMNDKELWYANIPDRVTMAKTPGQDAQYISVNENEVDKETQKKRDESLHAALESSIKAPNINSNRVSGLSSGFSSDDESLSEPNNFNDKQSLSENNHNLQNEKLIFLEKSMQHTNSDYLYEMVKKPLSLYEIKAGTIIPAVLIVGVNSDLPGQLTALVTKNVFDTVSGRYLLIPQGSKLILQYDFRIAYGQERLLVVAKRLIFPNGNSLDLDSMPVIDESGYAGFYDQVDNHYLRIFGSSGIMGLITGGFELSQSQKASNQNNSSALQVMDGAMGQQMGQVTLGMMNKNLEIQPTIKIRPGREFNVTVTADMIFPGQY
jgi:type IV secretory pathway VirB10-like protein